MVSPLESLRGRIDPDKRKEKKGRTVDKRLSDFYRRTHFENLEDRRMMAFDFGDLFPSDFFDNLPGFSDDDPPAEVAPEDPAPVTDPPTPDPDPDPDPIDPDPPAPDTGTPLNPTINLDLKLNEFNTPEEKLTWLNDQKDQAETQITHINGGIQSANTQITNLNYTLRGINDRIAELQEGGNETLVTPRFSVSAPNGERLREVTIEYSDMPEDIYAEILKNGRSYDKEELRYSTGAAKLRIDRYGVESYEIQLYKRESFWDHETVTDIPVITFTTVDGVVQEDVDPQHYSIPSLAYSSDGSNNASELASLIAERDQTQLRIEALETGRERDRAEVTELQAYVTKLNQKITEIEQGLPNPDAVDEILANAQEVFGRVHAWEAEPLSQETSMETVLSSLTDDFTELSILTTDLTVAIDTLQPLLQEENPDTALVSSLDTAVDTLSGYIDEWQYKNEQMVTMVETEIANVIPPNSDVLSFENPLEVLGGSYPSMRIALPNVGGDATFKIWKGDLSSGTLDVNEEGDTLTANGSLLTFDLSNADTLVTDFSTTVNSHNANGKILVGFFHGTTLLHSQGVSDGEEISFSDPLGITSVGFIKSASTTTIELTNTETSADLEQFQTTVDTLSGANNRWVGYRGLPQLDNGAEFNYYDVGVEYGATYAFSNHDIRVTGAPMIPPGMGEVSNYRNFTVVNFGTSSVYIDEVFYLTDSSIRKLPEEYYTKASSQSIIVHAGAPRYILLKIAGSGSYSFETKEGSTLEAVEPPEGVVMQPRILAFIVQHTGSEGFRDPITEIRQSHRPILSGAIHMLANVSNIGSDGGEVTINVHYGYSHSTDDNIVKSFTTNFAANQVRGLAVNLSDPSGGGEGYPAVTLSIIVPSTGMVFNDVSGGGSHRSMDMRVSTDNGEYVSVSAPTSLEDEEALAHAAYDAWYYAISQGKMEMGLGEYTDYALAARSAATTAQRQEAADVVFEEDATPEERAAQELLSDLSVEMQAAGAVLGVQKFYVDIGANGEDVIHAEYTAEDGSTVLLTQSGENTFVISVGELVASAGEIDVFVEPVTVQLQTNQLLSLSENFDQVDDPGVPLTFGGQLEPALASFVGDLNSHQVKAVQDIAALQRSYYGEKMEAFINENEDEFSGKIGAALMRAIIVSSERPERSEASDMFEWTGEYNPWNQGISYYLSRPVNIPGLSLFFSHNFIVTNAKYLGDPNATVISFGQNDSGNLGMVDYCTNNNASATTHAGDVNAWLSLADTEGTSSIKHTLIPADSSAVRDLAFSVMEDQDYAMISGIFGINSNSAAHAIANNFGDISDPSNRISMGSGNADKIKFGYYVRENGCGSGLYFEE